MRVVQICPGSGDSFYCENCLRDAALVKALRKLGHDVLMVPLCWIDRWLDSGWLLEWAGRKAGMGKTFESGRTAEQMMSVYERVIQRV